MTLTVAQAHAVNRLCDYLLDAPRPDRLYAGDAPPTTPKQAHAALMVLIDRLPAARCRLDARLGRRPSGAVNRRPRPVAAAVLDGGYLRGQRRRDPGGRTWILDPRWIEPYRLAAGATVRVGISATVILDDGDEVVVALEGENHYRRVSRSAIRSVCDQHRQAAR